MQVVRVFLVKFRSHSPGLSLIADVIQGGGHPQLGGDELGIHILGDAETLCDRVAVLHKGELKGVGVVADGVNMSVTRARPGDQVIIRGEKAFGVGRAKMSGWEMVESRRGVAAELRHVEKL